MERKFRAVYEQNIEESNNGNTYNHYTIEYVNHVVATAQALGLDLFEFYSIPSENNIYEEYQKFRHEVDNFTVRIQISHIRSGRKNSIALDEREKKHLRAYADAIKGVIDQSSLVPAKRVGCTRKLMRLLRS